jgi:hypothetical protein
MNNPLWYEFASIDEVKATLFMFYENAFVYNGWAKDMTEEQLKKLVEYVKELAEAVWGEQSKEN